LIELAICQFTAEYYDNESKKMTFKCKEEALESSSCIFHDKNYLNHYLSSFREERKKKVKNRLMDMINKVSSLEPLLCIGYHLPDIKIEGTLSKPVHFIQSKFEGTADFSEATFSGEAIFKEATFSGEASFKGATFLGKTYFATATFFREADFSGANFQGEYLMRYPSIL